jgi:signal transduction histidine kinase
MADLRFSLKRETADLHRRLEGDLGLLQSDLSLERYRRVLEFFFGFYAPLEAGLAGAAAAGPPLGLSLPSRTALIEGDLQSLGLSRREIADLPRCKADPERIFRVLSNLLGNAIKFTPEEGTITVRTERRGDDLSIAVTDTGPGITADHLPHVFERYWKAPSTSEPGSGLGLYIASGIVEAHGGKIWAESSTAGARFAFTLPLAR